MAKRPSPPTAEAPPRAPRKAGRPTSAKPPRPRAAKAAPAPEAPKPSSPPPEAEAPVGPRVVKDAHGTVLADGDCVVLIKDLKLGGGSQVLSGGVAAKSRAGKADMGRSGGAP